MPDNKYSFPKIVSRDEWTAERKKLLEEEKEFTRQRDRLNIKRRELPMVEIKKEYEFEGPDGSIVCPACLATAVWNATGTTASGGFAAWMVKKLQKKERKALVTNEKSKSKQHEKPQPKSQFGRRHAVTNAKNTR